MQIARFEFSKQSEDDAMSRRVSLISFLVAMIVAVDVGSAVFAQSESPRREPPPPPLPVDPAPVIPTELELSGFEKHTSYDGMMTFLQQLQGTSLRMKLGIYGKTQEGRSLPYAVLSKPTVTQPWEALVSGKPIVVLSANVHGGERTLRESLLILLRELATEGTEANGWLQDLVVVVVPSINPDGFTRNQRGNAWGVDLNRDYMKLEHATLVALVRNIHGKWHPHVVVDGHNGGALPYNICYQAASNASADPALTRLCDKRIFPFVDAELKQQEFKSFFYARGNRTQWTTGGHQARISRNYVGLTNSVGILFESPAKQPLETGVRSGVIAYKAILKYTRANADDVMTLVNRTRRETAEMGERAVDRVMVKMKYEAEDETVRYEIEEGEGAEKRYVTIADGKLFKKPVVTASRPRPYAYLLPREAKQAVALLRRHGISVETLQTETTIEVDAYTLEGISYRKEYDHPSAVEVKIGKTVREKREFPAGTYVVSTAQLLGRVAAHLLEPETDDSLVHWNVFDAWLPKAALAETNNATGTDSSKKTPAIIPIYKIPRATPLPTRLLGE
jgi:hypothetical protein